MVDFLPQLPFSEDHCLRQIRPFGDDLQEWSGFLEIRCSEVSEFFDLDEKGLGVLQVQEARRVAVFAHLKTDLVDEGPIFVPLRFFHAGERVPVDVGPILLGGWLAGPWTSPEEVHSRTGVLLGVGEKYVAAPTVARPPFIERCARCNVVTGLRPVRRHHFSDGGDHFVWVSFENEPIGVFAELDEVVAYACLAARDAGRDPLFFEVRGRFYVEVRYAPQGDRGCGCWLGDAHACGVGLLRFKRVCVLHSLSPVS